MDLRDSTNQLITKSLNNHVITINSKYSIKKITCYRTMTCFVVFIISAACMLVWILYPYY